MKIERGEATRRALCLAAEALVAQHGLEQVTLRVEGEHMLRRPLRHVLAEGFEIERAERIKAGIVERIAARKRRSA